jgi:hypothetical protein
MTYFELLSCLFLGLGSGFMLSALARWRSVGAFRTVVLSALGGLVGGEVGAGMFPQGPVWGDMPYHVTAAAFAVVGGCSAVALVRLLIGHPGIPGDSLLPRR